MAAAVSGCGSGGPARAAVHAVAPSERDARGCGEGGDSGPQAASVVGAAQGDRDAETGAAQYRVAGAEHRGRDSQATWLGAPASAPAWHARCATWRREHPDTTESGVG